MCLEAELTQIIEQIEIPYANETLKALHAVRSVTLDTEGAVVVELVLGFPFKRGEELLKQKISQSLEKVDGVKKVSVQIEIKIASHQVQNEVSRLAGVRNIIAVTSGKGGVGKSTTAVNLAAALALEGATVGILDADIHGPSLPRMLGISDEVMEGYGEGRLEPIKAYGVSMMSVGLLVENDTPMIWRGPMITQVFEKLLRETDWGKLDYLIVDMPPGTGDIQITLAQRVPLTGVILVTTPQAVAVDDASRCLNMFKKVRVPIIGLIENMSGFCCPHCQAETAFFGSGGASQMKAAYGVDILGQLPMDSSIGLQTEKGTPIVIADPESPSATRYRNIAVRAAAKVAKLAKATSTVFPKIVVENSR